MRLDGREIARKYAGSNIFDVTITIGQTGQDGDSAMRNTNYGIRMRGLDSNPNLLANMSMRVIEYSLLWFKSLGHALRSGRYQKAGHMPSNWLGQCYPRVSLPQTYFDEIIRLVYEL